MKISKGPDKNVQQGIDLFTPLFTPLLTQSRCEHCSGKGLMPLYIRDHFEGVWGRK